MTIWQKMWGEVTGSVAKSLFVSVFSALHLQRIKGRALSLSLNFAFSLFLLKL